MVAIGFYLTAAGTGIINFAQGTLVSLGSLFMAAFFPESGLFIVPMLLLVVIFCGGVGYVTERLLIHPILHRGPMPCIVATLAISIGLQALMFIFFGGASRGVAQFTEGGPWQIAGAHILRQQAWIMGAMVIVGVGTYVLFSRTLRGKSLLAAADNATGARVVGIDPKRVTTAMFVLAAAISGLAGAVAAPVIGASFDSGIAFSLKGFAAASIGGFGSPYGAAAGGLGLGVVESFAGSIFPSQYRDVIVLGIFILALTVRPQGFTGVGRGSARRAQRKLMRREALT